MKNPLLKLIVAASLAFSAQTFAQDEDQEYYNYGQEEQESAQSDEESAASEDESPKTTAEADVKTNAPANVQVNINVNVQNNNTNNNNIQNNSQSTSNSSAESYASVNSSAPKGHDAGVGVRVAFGYASMFGFKETDDEFSDSPSGFSVEGGLTARVEMVNNLYFVPEVNFNYISTSHSGDVDDRSYSSMNLDIPLMFRGVVAERFYVNAGPQLSLCLSSNVDAPVTMTDPITHKDITETIDDFEQTAFTFGLVAGAGINIVEGLYIDFRFYMGLSELYPDANYIGDGYTNMDEVKNLSYINMAGAKNMVFKIGVGYWFN